MVYFRRSVLVQQGKSKKSKGTHNEILIYQAFSWKFTGKLFQPACTSKRGAEIKQPLKIARKAYLISFYNFEFLEYALRRIQN